MSAGQFGKTSIDLYMTAVDMTAVRSWTAFVSFSFQEFGLKLLNFNFLSFQIFDCSHHPLQISGCKVALQLTSLLDSALQSDLRYASSNCLILNSMMIIASFYQCTILLFFWIHIMLCVEIVNHDWDVNPPSARDLFRRDQNSIYTRTGSLQHKPRLNCLVLNMTHNYYSRQKYYIWRQGVVSDMWSTGGPSGKQNFNKQPVWIVVCVNSENSDFMKLCSLLVCPCVYSSVQAACSWTKAEQGIWTRNLLV